MVLSILVTRKDGTYIGGPMGNTKLLPYDTIMLYGRTSAVQKLDERKRGQTGDEEHVREVVRQMGVVQEQEADDPAEK